MYQRKYPRPQLGDNNNCLDLEGGGGISGEDNESDLVSHVGGNLAIDSVPYG